MIAEAAARSLVPRSESRSRVLVVLTGIQPALASAHQRSACQRAPRLINLFHGCTFRVSPYLHTISTHSNLPLVNLKGTCRAVLCSVAVTMAEAFGAVTGAAGNLSLGITICRSLLDYYGGPKDAKSTGERTHGLWKISPRSSC